MSKTMTYKLTCSRCGRGIQPKSQSYIVDSDGNYVHKACISKMTPNEKKEYRKLTDKIQWYIATANRNTSVSSYNWQNIAKKIKELRLSGYSFDEIEYALDATVKMMGGFYGFGAVVNRIYPIIQKKKEREHLGLKSDEPEIEIVYRVTEDDIDF